MLYYGNDSYSFLYILKEKIVILMYIFINIIGYELR